MSDASRVSPEWFCHDPGGTVFSHPGEKDCQASLSGMCLQLTQNNVQCRAGDCELAEVVSRG